jgi:putative PIN family toxin of toxin-antitoxin system
MRMSGDAESEAVTNDCICAIIRDVIVVVDTSVFVAALLGPSGASRSILRACLDGRLSPLMGTALFAEYESLLSREALFRDCRLDRGQREAVLDAFLGICSWTVIYFSWRPNLRDEADNHLIELAVAGAARAIVTKNTRDFRSAELQFPGLRIMQPEELVKEMQSWVP